MKIIINADDFGLSKKVNEAIYKSAMEKYITSATIMAVASQLDEAIEMSQELSSISLGIHLVFDDDFRSLSGQPVSFQENSLVNLRRLNLFKLDILVKEFSMQIEKLLHKGIKISHIDTHHHLHLYPLVILAVLKVSKKYGINKIRSQKLIGNDMSKAFINKIYRSMHYNFVKANRKTQPDYYADFPTFLNKDVAKDSNAVYEIMCHPGSDYGYNDEQYFNDEIYAKLYNNLITYNDIEVKKGIFHV